MQLLTRAQAKHRLLLILSEPDVGPSCPEGFRHDFPREARAEVKQFIEHHYPLGQALYPVEFFGKFFKSSVFDTETKQLENLLAGVSAVVLYSDLTDEKHYLHLYAWGLPEPLSETIAWNWEEAKEKLEAEGKTEKQALRDIRKTIVALYQLFAALLADMYYLSVNPLHEPRLFHLSGTADTAAVLAPFLDTLREFQRQVREAYERDIRDGTREPPPRQETPPTGPQLPPVENIHGWPADKVRDLQQRTAAALGKPVVFHDSMKSGGLGPEMVVIPAGTFLMGSPSNESERLDNEGPQHQVTFAKPFAIGKYAVTFEEYERFRRAKDKGWGRGRRPVINVSWDDAQAYCQWLSAETGQAYRLPSEAEWEYACRAGTMTRYHVGNTLQQHQANHDKPVMATLGAVFGLGGTGTKPVGQYPGNAFGLYDMHGNVSEWCADAWHGNYEGAPQNGSAWTMDGSATRVVRGGSWDYYPVWLRSAFRSFRFASNRSHRPGVSPRPGLIAFIL